MMKVLPTIGVICGLIVTVGALNGHPPSFLSLLTPAMWALVVLIGEFKNG